VNRTFFNILRSPLDGDGWSDERAPRFENREWMPAIEVVVVRTRPLTAIEVGRVAGSLYALRYPGHNAANLVVSFTISRVEVEVRCLLNDTSRYGTGRKPDPKTWERERRIEARMIARDALAWAAPEEPTAE
jgi:hypothetical protein